MLESITNNVFEYKKLSEEEQKKRGILGRLVGVIADAVNPTRNGRKYSIDLWQKVFDNPLTKEKIETRTCFGEACHPIDGRMEVDPEKVAICLAEVPKKNSKGQLIGIFDILDTPCGRILKTMCDYGTTIGISSRGSGDTFENYDGVEEVDPDTYDFVGFDAVFTPGVKEARLKLVNESYNGKTLKKALQEDYNNSSEDDKRVMKETLNELGIDINTEEETDKPAEEAVLDIVDSEDSAVVDDKADIVKDLQEALEQKMKLESDIVSLNEKLSVSYAKESQFKDKTVAYKASIRKLSEQLEASKIANNKLQEQLNNENSLKETISNLRNRNHELKESSSKLQESLDKTESLLESLKQENKKLREEKVNIEKELQKENQTLEESYEDLKKDLAIKRSEYTKKLSQASTLVEKYKNIAKESVDRYIEFRAIQIGVSKEEVKNKLTEFYSFNDIDNICEELKQYKLNISQLPFETAKSSFQIKAKQNIKESILPKSRFDDEVDDSLLKLASEFGNE